MKVSYLVKIAPKYMYEILKSSHRKLPKYKASELPRVAFCLYGLIGGIKSKSGESIASSEDVLEIGYKHYKEHIFDKNPNVDVFIHTWSVDLKKQINKLYRPKKVIFQKQIKFKVPNYAAGEYQRKQNHYSRWYSTKKVIELKRQYEIKNKFRYDIVILTRFDIALQKNFEFDRFNPKYFYAANWYSRYDLFKIFPIYIPIGLPYSNHSLADIWFFSNSKNMDKFSKLYNKLNEYNKLGNCPRTRFGISNHSLAGYHLEKIGLIKRLRLIFCRKVFDTNKMPFFKNYGPKETTPLIRRKFFNCKK